MNQPGGRRAGLWDRAQVEAFVVGEPVPELPTVDSPDDLFDASEAAALAGIELTTWLRYDERDRGLVPDPDAVLHGQKHYRRGTLATWLANRPGRGAGSGRRPKNGASEGELRARTTALVAAAETEGRRLSAREVGRALGVSPAKAGKLLAVALAAAPAK
ncbi:MAG: hypothetical protein L0I76_22465 [Pseudonocardia sp.]|nr:hypothetical protein [Pseudonocardia sp.]